ncbi:putative glycoside hydrolase family 115 protein [Phaeomoniella chlamydospora]|uniref:Putative glycoside hydrolase family 115 protein n=1 Tax=Phaeomoniella chlamydospora TaxID=158046 RepID=A0A0G2EIC8_PHACM|nr:putative glycoside hydrolase family 115 protein [Phaeomoniella chlamydospora]
MSLYKGLISLSQAWIILFETSTSAIQLAGPNLQAQIILDETDWPGVIRAGRDLATDFGKITGKNSSVSLINGTTAGPIFQTPSSAAIIAGTIGKSGVIDSLINSGKLEVSQIQGKWESFHTQVVSDPIPGISQGLVIAGSDKRGTIYGIYDISEQIGVSPWYWWADVATVAQNEIYALNRTKTQGPPSVKYRGIFLNDEQPALNNWVQENYPDGEYGPGFNADFYSHVFELLLRLRANYLWPTMWASMFNVDDGRSQPLADYYGIVMGTSHTEPMMRASIEQSLFLNGSWDWSTNNVSVYEFMKDGAERAKPYESLFTMGMRGYGDVASPTITADSLGLIVQAQQEILQDVFKTTNTSTIPQMWCLYKEVGGYYQEGLRIPDDITMLWSDDNWGAISRVPLANETSRSGGAGVYYHFDYVGDPRDYKWINTISLERTWQQMYMAYQTKATQIWVVNVGDLKPLEVPINHFLDLAYDTTLYTSPNSTIQWLEWWASREFGSAVASEVADIMDTYGFYAARRKYELVVPTVYSLINYDEANIVLSEWQNLTARAQSVFDKLSAAAKPSFFELVLHPCMAAYTVYQIHINAAKNNLYAEQRRTSANTWAEYARTAFHKDHAITQRYHQLLDGKWNHMMDQTHLGYDYWQQPMRNTMPPVAYVQLAETSVAGQMGLTVEGSNGSVAGDSQYNVALSNNTLVLPPMDPYGPPTRWIEIYSRGTDSFDFEIKPYDSWVTATPSSGTLSATGNNTDIRVTISVDWSKAPSGSTVSFINVTTPGGYGNFDMPSVNLPINKTSVPETFHGFIESDSTVSIEPEHFTKNVSSTSASVYYVVIPKYGRTLSGVTLLPATAPSQNTTSGPHLEYSIYFFTNTSNANITVYVGPTLNTNPSAPLKYAVSIGDEKPQIVQPIPSTSLGTLPGTWTAQVSDAAASNTTMHNVTAGATTLKLWALEPNLVFQKIVVDLGGVRESYLGPPESMRV